MRPRVILIEDDTELRESLLEYLELAELTVAGVASAIEFYQLLNSCTFDIAIVDIGLPDQSGYELAQYLRDKTTMGIIILTARSSTKDRIQGYKAGADLYFVKPVDCVEMVAAIHNLLDRLSRQQNRHHRQQATEWLMDKANWSLTTPNGLSVNLTGKEMTFLELLTIQSGEIVPRELLMNSLNYDQEQYDNRALDALVLRLRKKIETVNSHDDPIKTVHAVGYCFSAPVRTEQMSLSTEKPLP